MEVFLFSIFAMRLLIMIVFFLNWMTIYEYTDINKFII